MINVITRQGGERFLSDASYYGQAAGLTSQPVALAIPRLQRVTSGYERDRYRDFTTKLGGPVVRDRLWFFAGYQRLRDYDSQPGSGLVPQDLRARQSPRETHLGLAPGWQLVQSVHYESWVNPDPPTTVTPFEATLRADASVPAITFGHLTHTLRPTRSGTCGSDASYIHRTNTPSSATRTTPAGSTV